MSNQDNHAMETEASPQAENTLPDGEPTILKLLEEINQSPRIRQSLIARLEELIKPRRVVTFFTSSIYPSTIEDSDADMIEGVLQKIDCTQGLVLVINSQGGSGLAAERIVNVCRKYSNGKFEVIVPKMAKSAATMVCLGADKIHMSDTSELGPIDPQVAYRDQSEQRFVWVSLWSVLESYRTLLGQAVAEKGNIDPYLLQLARYDARQIKQWELEQSLSEDIAIQVLASGMMKDKATDQIRKNIELLLDPQQTMSHGRPIYYQQATAMGLNIEHHPNRSEYWDVVWEIYIRTGHNVNSMSQKAVETSKGSFSVPAPVDRP